MAKHFRAFLMANLGGLRHEKNFFRGDLNNAPDGATVLV